MKIKDDGAGLIGGFLSGLKPEPRLTVTEWADKHRILDSKAASEPGPYRSNRTPYWIEPMNNLSVTNPVRKIVIMKGAQVGATEIGLNFIGYVIDVAPGPFLAVMPTDETVKRNSKMRIAPMIEASPRLREKVKPARSRDSGNSITQKEFPGGVLILTGANSGVGLRSMPARFLMLDEVDGYPMDVDGEGSPIGLAEQRTATYPNRKILEISTPTVEGESIIEADFNLTDKRYYFVPCPFCGGMQKLEFAYLQWEPGNYSTAKYRCAHCEELILERFKPQMLAAGRWQKTSTSINNPLVVGYHISALYSPFGWKSWAEIAEQWEAAQGDTNKLKLFYNTVLGETWAIKTDAPQWELIYQKTVDYPLNKPFATIAFITAGADVQADRIEIEIVGWGKGKISQHLDYRVILGDTTQPEVWQKLDNILDEFWIDENGRQIPLKLTAIDSGYNTSIVYAWAKRHSFTRVIPIKGSDRLDTYFAPPRVLDYSKHGKKVGKVKVWHIGSTFIKNELYSNLRKNIDPETSAVPEGFCYFPGKDAHYFKGLTAEVQELRRNTRGYLTTTWVKKYERNEPLDCRVYARAAASIVGMDTWSETKWQNEATNHANRVEKPKGSAPSPEQRARKSRSNYWNR